LTAAIVVDVVVEVVVDDVDVVELVDVDATMVVDAVVVAATVVVTMECCTSLHAASTNANASGAARTRRNDMWRVCQQRMPLADQGVSLVAALDEMQHPVDDVDDGDRAVVEAANDEPIVAAGSTDDDVDGHEVAEHHSVDRL